MELESIIGQMDKFTLENIDKALNMGMEFTNFLSRRCTLATSEKANNMDWASVWSGM